MSKTAAVVAIVIALIVVGWAFRAYGTPEMLMNLLNLRSCGV